MSDVDNVGEVSVDGGTTLRWTLPRYMQMPHGVDTLLRSPDFTFRGVEECRLGAYPNGLKFKRSEGWTGIGCFLRSLPPASTVTCCLVGSEGREILHTDTTERGGDCYIQFKWIRRNELEARSGELLPGGTLRIVVRVVLPDERGHRAEEEDDESGARADSRSFSESSASDASRRHIHKVSPASLGVDKLIQNLKTLFIGNKDCDFIIRVRGREFRAHRLILKAMIPAFDAMLTHDTAENKEGIVNMEDCDPDVFHEFLLFVYSGRVENLSPDNMCGLYVLADKYDLHELKAACLDFMKTSLSVEMICDVLRLATRHDETELLKLATDFFVNYAEEIMVTGKWKVFLAEDLNEGNELLLKAVKHGKIKKTAQ